MKSSSNIIHLKALLRKNWILWKRSWGCSTCELIFPIIFTFLYLILRNGNPFITNAEVSYYSDPFIFNSTLTIDSMPYLKQCTQKNLGSVALAPQGDVIIELMKTTLESFNFTTKYFSNNADIESYIKASNYIISEKICFGVALEKNNQNNQYEYHLKFNTTEDHDDDEHVTDLPQNQALDRVNPLSKQNLKSLESFARNGSLLIQNWIDNLILQKELSNPAASIKAEISSVRTPKYLDDSIGGTLGGISQLLLVVPLLVPYVRMVSAIFKEKEKRIKEGMKIMGLSGVTFYQSWLITYGIIFTIISLCASIILKISVMTYSNLGLIFLWFWLCTMSTMLMGALITILFSTAKIGNVVSFVVVFVLAWPFQMVRDGSSLVNKVFALFGPPTSFGLVADSIFLLEKYEMGLTTETINLEFLSFNIMYAYIIMSISIVIYLALIFYLDMVMPTEFGISKHPLFCIRRKKDDTKEIPFREEPNPFAENFEDVEPNLKVQDEQLESIKVQSLRKIYSNSKLAVDGVTYNMYKGQIFALLGHNGAGKSSTINMITGLYPASSGTVKVFDKDIHQDLDEIRKKLGVCPQQDVLFDELTVKEHLELFAAFKGAKLNEVQQEITELIESLDLKDKTNALSSSLSGGQKRRLCVGMAFVGGSQFILLDEPSSGMDPTARRKLWDMLKNSKQGKVILLTTHFMDEADFLGDRIAIMGEGKIRCLGSSLFLKNKFGEGYSLTFVKSSAEAPSEKITKAVQKFIPDAKIISNVSAEVSFQLPVVDLPYFKAMFEYLDSHSKELEINSYGVSVTTLEEVFLNVANISHGPNKIDQGEEAKLESAEIENFDLEEKRIRGSINIFFIQLIALLRKRIISLRRDKRALLIEILLPVIMILIGIALSLNPFRLKTIALEVTDDYYNEVNQVPYNSKLASGLNIDPNFINGFSTNNFNLIPLSSNSLSEFDADLFNIRGMTPFPKFGMYLQKLDHSTHSYEYFAEIDTRAQDSSSFAVNKINQVILRYATGNTAKSIIYHNSPLPDPDYTSYSGTYTGITVSFSLSIGMSFIPAGITTYISRERDTNAKHQQVISGMSLFAYWTSNFIVDVGKSIIPCIAGPVIAKALGADDLTAEDKYSQLWQIFIFYGLAVIPFSYLLAFAYKDFSSAQTSSFFLNFGIGFIGGLALTVLSIFGGSDSIASVIQWPLRIIPTFAMSYGFLNLSGTNFISSGKEGSAYDDILFLWIMSLVSFAGLIAYESLKGKKFKIFKSNAVAAVQEGPIDGDVQQEIENIESTNEKFGIKVKSLRKIYKVNRKNYKIAVDRVSFGIKNGECFTLLGVNGAGKTTSFKMMTGDVIPTDGEIIINGYSVPNDLTKARKYIGYCPQFDALFDNLTAREHLQLYAALKGIPKEFTGRLVEKQLQELNLDKFANIPAGTYSGGNKRKLSVAIALLGNPPIVFLDEPSTGMDPEARRYMWNVISKISKGAETGKKGASSVILTTHSMEEAEALSTRIGIQVSGNLKCLGSIQHIKNRYGGGYELEIKVKYPSSEEIEDSIKSWKMDLRSKLDRQQLDDLLNNIGRSYVAGEIKESGSGGAIFVELKSGFVPARMVAEWLLLEEKGKHLIQTLNSCFRDLIVLEHFQSFYRLKIASDISIGQVFGIIEEKKNETSIVQYSVRQSSIEQIFNRFATNNIIIKPKEVTVEIKEVAVQENQQNEIKI